MALNTGSDLDFEARFDAKYNNELAKCTKTLASKIAVVTTGGTISMQESDGGLELSTTSPIGAMIGEARGDLTIDILEFSNKPSEHMSLEDFMALQRFIDAHADRYDAFVITHGTDTMEECAYFLYRTLSCRRGVVITGAMRAANEPSSDGEANLLAAIATARVAKSIVIVMDDKILSPTDVMKGNTSSTDAFRPRHFGLLGYVNDGAAYFHDKRYIECDALVREIVPYKEIASVPIIKIYPSMDMEIFDIVADMHGRYKKAVVIEAYGKGNVSLEVAKRIEDLLAIGVEVVISSCIRQGVVTASYNYAGGSSSLAKKGAKLAGYKSSAMARIDLAIGASSDDKGAI